MSTSSLRKTSVFERNAPKSTMLANYGSLESAAYRWCRPIINGLFSETGVFPQPARKRIVENRAATVRERGLHRIASPRSLTVGALLICSALAGAANFEDDVRPIFVRQ